MTHFYGAKDTTIPHCEAGAMLQVRFAQKMRKYHDICWEAGMDFIPLPVSTLGGWHPEAAKVISRLRGDPGIGHWKGGGSNLSSFPVALHSAH